MICPRCGTKIDSLPCPNCGFPVLRSPFGIVAKRRADDCPADKEINERITAGYGHHE